MEDAMRHQFIAMLRSLQVIGGRPKQYRFLPQVLNSVIITFLLLSSFIGTAQASSGNFNDKLAETNSSQAQAAFLPNAGKFLADFGKEFQPQQQGGGACIQAPAGLIDMWPAEGNAQDILDIHNGVLQSGTAFAP